MKCLVATLLDSRRLGDLRSEGRITQIWEHKQFLKSCVTFTGPWSYRMQKSFAVFGNRASTQVLPSLTNRCATWLSDAGMTSWLKCEKNKTEIN